MKRLGLFCLLLILALGTMGAAYGLWYEWMWFRVYVDTGEVDVGMSLDDIWDVESKDVATCEAVLYEDFACPGFQPCSDGYDRLDITVSNAYPSYECHVIYNVENLGTIPVHFDLVGPEGNLELLNAITFTDCPDLRYLQLHPGDITYCHIIIHFDNDTPGITENGDYGIGWDIFAYQYNETP